MREEFKPIRYNLVLEPDIGSVVSEEEDFKV
jgi:hypothetical protein